MYECELNLSVYEELVEYVENCIPTLNPKTNEIPKIPIIETFPMTLLGEKKNLFKMTTCSDSWSTENSEYAEFDFFAYHFRNSLLHKVQKFEISNFL